MGDELKRRILVVYELGGLGQRGSDGLEMAKQLLTEGKISRQIAESSNTGVKGRHTMVEGPTSLWTTTTKVFTDHELSTRLFKFQPDDSLAQTRAIIMGIFSETRAPVDFAPFKALHTWLAGQDNTVTIPYGEVLARKMVASAVRLRRDASRLKNLIRAHAVLHQATRERDQQGCIVATLEDYEAVRSLIDNMIGVAAEKSIKPTVRETVEAAERIESNDESITAARVAKVLGIDRSPAQRRLTAAVDAGYLEPDNFEGRAKTYKRTNEPIPTDTPVLPTKDQLCTCARDSRGERVGENHDESCPQNRAQLRAQVHAQFDDRGGGSSKADRYKEYSDGHPTEDTPVTEVGNPVHSCTATMHEAQNPDLGMHRCTQVCTAMGTCVWEWAIAE